MQRDDPVRLRHMLDAAMEAELFAQNKIRSDLDTDRKLVLALVKDIEIIGEAAANVTDRCQGNTPQILWQLLNKVNTSASCMKWRSERSLLEYWEM